MKKINKNNQEDFTNFHIEVSDHFQRDFHIWFENGHLIVRYVDDCDKNTDNIYQYIEDNYYFYDGEEV
jgi:hypothetical protein